MSRTPTSQQALPIDPIEGALKSFMERLFLGDPNALPELRTWLQDHPAIWSQCGDLAQHTEQAARDLLAGWNPLVQEAVFRRVQELKAELAGPSATAIEKLLASQVVMDWLLLNLADQALLPNSALRSAHSLQRNLLREDAGDTPYAAHQLRPDLGQGIPIDGAARVRAAIARLTGGEPAVDYQKDIKKTVADPIKGTRAAEHPAAAP